MLKTLEWISSYESGIIEQDNQHKHIIGIINGIYAYFQINLTHQIDIGKFNTIIDSLIEEYENHFKIEEAIMESLLYPHTEVHKKEHFKISLILDNFKKNIKKKQKIEVIQFLEFVNNWLFDHLNIDDLEFIKWYKLQDNGDKNGRNEEIEMRR